MDAQPTVFDYLENRILTHYPEARMILDGQMPAPRTAIVYPTYVCNQNCRWCEYAADNRDIHTTMSTDQLRGLMLDLHALGVQGVEFCGGGEPTLHPALPEILREMNGMGMRSGLLTNGTRMKGKLAQAVVDCSSYVRIGFDGADAETMERLKRPSTPEAGYAAVRANVAALVALRNECQTRLLISMKVILTAENYTQVEDCVRLAAELGVDSIQFKAARLCDTELNDTQARDAQTRIQEARARHPEVSVVGSVKKVNMTQQCWLTPLQIMIDALGDVFLCCYYRHRRETHRFGNAFKTPLCDIWHGERHWKAIRAINPAECNLLDCRFVHYNQIMTMLLVENDAQFEFI